MLTRETRNHRMQILVSDGLDERLQEFRFARRYQAEAEALRFLIERGLESEGWAELGEGVWASLPARDAD